MRICARVTLTCYVSIVSKAINRYNLCCYMANVAQLIRAPGCGSGGRGFDPHHSPQI